VVADVPRLSARPRWENLGGPERIRTSDLRFRNAFRRSHLIPGSTAKAWFNYVFRDYYPNSYRKLPPSPR